MSENILIGGMQADSFGRIQELEKEREEIMNVFESQINNALQGLPMGDGLSSRPSTPSDSVMSSPKSRYTSMTRPMSGEGGQSIVSRFTSETPISVLAVARGGLPSRRKKLPEGMGGGSNEQEINDKTNLITLRIANIQQKVRRPST